MKEFYIYDPNTEEVPARKPGEPSFIYSVTVNRLAPSDPCVTVRRHDDDLGANYYVKVRTSSWEQVWLFQNVATQLEKHIMAGDTAIEDGEEKVFIPMINEM